MQKCVWKSRIRQKEIIKLDEFKDDQLLGEQKGFL